LNHQDFAQTVRLALAVLSLAGCEAKDGADGSRADANVAADAGTTAGDAGATTPDASDARVGASGDAAQDASTNAAVGACEKHTDCTMVARGCCAACSPTKADYIAAPVALAAAVKKSECPAGNVACSPCPPQVDQPLAPRLRAACVAQRCEIVDLREQDVSRCTSDTECGLDSLGCCPGCGSDPSAYVSLRVGADDSVLACFPIPPCDPCVQSGPAPQAYCAADGHCAVRR